MSNVPWEPLDQISPGQMPSPSDIHPAPWSVQSRGNGHVDVFDVNSGYVAHVYCWDKVDYDLLAHKISLTLIKKDNE